MLFNSLEFLIFLLMVFCLYWFVFQKNLKAQNLLLLISSYVFYGWWDWRFLSLIFLSTVVDYFVGLKIHDSNDIKVKKSFLWISILFNLGLLGFFKYFNFFIDSWVDLLCAFGYEQKSVWTLNVILPVGISFYTFQTMSYSLDIFYGKLKPTKDFISFASFVSFFPQLVAGPIERASNLLPQILNNRMFKYDDGIKSIRQIIWGLFKKIVIADNCAQYANLIFNNFMDYNSSALILGLLFFSFQIYCDFSGYSDIAIGVSRLLGFELMLNFKSPYFSRDIGEFWRRWHISLSTWFRDYLYIPLGGSKRGKWLSIRNIFIIFIVSGFWHGANWTFIMWGLTHAILYIPLFLRAKNRQYNTLIVAEDKWLPSLKELFQIGSTFFFVMISWVFFRSDSVTNAFIYLNNIFHISIFDIPNFTGKTYALKTLGFILLLIFIDWKNRFHSFGFEKNIFNKNNHLDLIFLILLIVFYRNLALNLEFIYFQF
jgi:alginate O-acetyltransferase complex protein AlgI